MYSNLRVQIFVMDIANFINGPAILYYAKYICNSELLLTVI